MFRPLPAVVFAACAWLLCGSVIVIVGWLLANGLPKVVSALGPRGPESAIGPLFATAYITVLALPPAAAVGVFAAMGASDVRIFGAAAGSMRSALSLVGSVPTVIVAYAALLAAAGVGWHPSLTGAAFVFAIVNMPLMTGLALRALTTRAAKLREVATALGAPPMYIVISVLLPRARMRLRSAYIIVATQIIGGAATIAILAGASVPGSRGALPIHAWPLAVHIWLRTNALSPLRGSSTGGYGGAAAAALLLAVLIWVLQGIAQLRAAPESASQEDL
ncbi:MAG: ABC transporter permease subunit [Candidatus Eremiobacteraeota bacterium]|nr:ABC transporter permease subunit [Candidatus Eremiobacteraeota bacterium]